MDTPRAVLRDVIPLAVWLGPESPTIDRPKEIFASSTETTANRGHDVDIVVKLAPLSIYYKFWISK